MADLNQTRRMAARGAQGLGMTALAAAIGLAFAAGAQAQQQDADSTPLRTPLLAPVQVQGDAPDYQADRLSSGKFTQPLVDTPQSVTVVPRQLIEEQRAQSLQEVLRNVPGITFTSGEGNLGWGDMFTIRGFSAEQSIMVDGIRDAGLASRSDTFNLERVEVFKGTGSLESGVSAVGGAVNLVSKEARLGSFRDLSTTLGSDETRRVTADLNEQLGATSALRVNLMRHTSNVAGRAVTDNDRWGMAGSLALGLGTPTRVTIDYLHQEDNNTPDGGVPILRGTGGKRMPSVSRSAWYGDPDLYRDDTKTDSATLKVEHDFSADTRVSNITRYERTDRLTVLSPARFNTVSGNSYGYGGAGPLTSASGVPSYSDYTQIADSGSTAARLRGNDFGVSKRYTILANQTNLALRFDTGAVRHDMVTGVEFYRERYGDLERSVRVPSTNPVLDLGRNHGVDMGGVSAIKGGAGNYAEIHDAGLYLADTATLTPRWKVLAALRYDRYHVTQVNGTENAHTTECSSDGAWSGRLGLTYKPADNGSLYLSYSQAAQPSAVGASSNNVIYGNTSDQRFKPAVSRTWEAGTKWELFDESLSVTGAVFRTELTDSWDYGDEAAVVRSLPAKAVHGLELGLAGQITPRWSAFAGLALMKSRITKGENKGAEAKNVPDATFNLWTTYAATDKLSLSYGVQYMGHRRYTDNKYVGGLNNNSSTVDGAQGRHPVYVKDDEKAPSYWLHSVAARYRFNETLTVGVNVDNLFDTFYYSRVGASLDGFQLYGVPGAGRTVSLTADLRF